MVTLQATGGVTFPSGPQTYGVVNSGATGTGTFHFSNDGTCGGTITLTFHLQDGDLDLGNVSIPFTLGLLVNSDPTFTENFDGVVAPALPAGWATAQSGAAPPWVTSTINDTAPNSAFGGGATAPGENSLTSPTIAIPTAPVSGTNPAVRLTFRNSYNTESGFDGGVLEISVNGGPFADIITAGGSFVEGGYNANIGVTDSVLTGRAAWTGNSGGFITTTVNLPPSSYGQNAQLSWRTAYDTGTNPTGGGMRVDTISIYTSTRVCCGGACVLTCPSNIEVSNDSDVCGAVVTYPAPTVVGNCGTVTASQDSGTLFPVGTTSVVITAARLDGTSDSCPFDVTVNDTQLPTISPITVALSSLWPSDHNLINVGLAGGTIGDNCSGATRQVFVYGDEDDQTNTGDGVNSPDAKDIDIGTLRLRSERVDSLDGRVYLIVVQVTDASGNTAFRVATVVVPKSQSAANINSVNAQAAAASAFFSANGVPPPGYFVIGDGPIIGPKQ